MKLLERGESRTNIYTIEEECFESKGHGSTTTMKVEST